MGGTESPLLMQESKGRWVSEQRKKPQRDIIGTVSTLGLLIPPPSPRWAHMVPGFHYQWWPPPQIPNVYSWFTPLSFELQDFKLNYWPGVTTTSNNHALSNDRPDSPWLHCVTSKLNLSITKLVIHPLNPSPPSCSHLVAPLNTLFSLTPVYRNRPKRSHFHFPKLVGQNALLFPSRTKCLSFSLEPPQQLAQPETHSAPSLLLLIQHQSTTLIFFPAKNPAMATHLTCWKLKFLYISHKTRGMLPSTSDVSGLILWCVLLHSGRSWAWNSFLT